MSRKLTFGGDERRRPEGWPLPWASPSPWSAGATLCHKDGVAVVEYVRSANREKAFS
jgi:hypothetical protein